MCGSHRTGRSTELQMGGADFRIVASEPAMPRQVPDRPSTLPILHAHQNSVPGDGTTAAIVDDMRYGPTIST